MPKEIIINRLRKLVHLVSALKERDPDSPEELKGYVQLYLFRKVRQVDDNSTTLDSSRYVIAESTKWLPGRPHIYNAAMPHANRPLASLVIFCPSLYEKHFDPEALDLEAVTGLTWYFSLFNFLLWYTKGTYTKGTWRYLTLWMHYC